jgi:hypothetical protein
MNMHDNARISALPLLALAVVVTQAFVRQDPAAKATSENRYIGAARCKNCHSTADSGDQYGAWKGEKHSQAFEVLASDEAKRYAKERGIDDPQKSEKCLKCHVTAFGAPKESLHRSFDPKLGVQCETCHGPGEKHLKARMAAAATQDPADKKAYTPVPADEIVSRPEMKRCLECHNDESPGFKPFCFHRFAADIRHLNPQKPRTPEQRAAILVCGCGDACACRDGCADGKCGVAPKTDADGKTEGKDGDKGDSKK